MSNISAMNYTDPNGLKAMHNDHLFYPFRSGSFAGGTALFAAAQIITVLLVLKTNVLGLQSPMVLYAIAICTPLPWIATVRGATHMCLPPDSTDTNVHQIRLMILLLFRVMGLGYFIEVFCLELLLISVKVR